MKIYLGVILAGVAVSMYGQAVPKKVALQEPGWIGGPGATTITVHVNRPDGQTGPVLDKPFSATEVRTTVQTLSDGTHVNHSDSDRFYRDAQGRMRSESATMVLLYDPVAGFTYRINPPKRSYSEIPIRDGIRSTSIAVDGDSTWINDTDKTGPPPPVQKVQVQKSGWMPFHSEPVNGIETEDLGERFINGIACKGTRITMTIPAGTFGNDRDVRVVNERWYSNDLMVLVRSINSDPRFGVTTYELTNIHEGSPAPGMFELPSGYTLTQFGQR